MRLSRQVLSCLVFTTMIATTGCAVQPMVSATVPATATRAQSLEGVTMGYRQVAQQMFDDMDANKDDALDKDELAAFKAKGGETAQILMADRNFDGKVTRDEFMDDAYVKLIVDQIRFQMANMFTALDRNGDGFLTSDELVAAKGPISTTLFKKYDRNSNGKLGLSEFEDLVWVDLMPKSVNPMNQTQVNADKFPKLPDTFVVTVVLANSDKVQSVMIKKDDATTPMVFLNRPNDPMPNRIIREMTPGGYSVVVKQTDGIAAVRHVDANQAATVTITATRNGPQLALQTAPSQNQ